MKKGIILSAFTLLIGVLALNSCGDNTSTPESVGGVLQNSNSVFDPFAPSASIDDEDNNSTEIPEEEAFPAALIGIWDGEDDIGIPYTLTINMDGTAVIENEYITYHFTFSERIGDVLSIAEYRYTCDEANDDGVFIGVRYGNSDIEFYDENNTSFWFDDYFMIYSDYPLDIVKRS